MRATVLSPYYDWDGRKYLELEINEKLVRVKIPFRYGRVMCRTRGIRTIQEIKKGEIIDVILDKKVWDGAEYWIISSFEEITSS
jgi:hypothetical protein